MIHDEAKIVYSTSTKQGTKVVNGVSKSDAEARRRAKAMLSMTSKWSNNSDMVYNRIQQ